jgi:hypothetical protein
MDTRRQGAGKGKSRMRGVEARQHGITSGVFAYPIQKIGRLDNPQPKQYDQPGIFKVPPDFDSHLQMIQLEAQFA